VETYPRVRDGLRGRGLWAGKRTEGEEAGKLVSSQRKGKPQRGPERPGGQGLSAFLETATSGARFPEGTNLRSRKPGEARFSGRKRQGRIGSGNGLRISGKIKALKGGSSGALSGRNKPGRASEVTQEWSVRRKRGNAQGGLGREMAPPSFDASLTMRWRAAKAQGGVSSRPVNARRSWRREGGAAPDQHPGGEGKPRRGAASSYLRLQRGVRGHTGKSLNDRPGEPEPERFYTTLEDSGGHPNPMRVTAAPDAVRRTFPQGRPAGLEFRIPRRAAPGRD